MRSSFRAKLAWAAALLAVTAYQSGGNAQPVSEVEVTADGLHRVDPSVLPNAWVRPDANFGQYTHAFVMPTVVLFREMSAPSRSSWADSHRSTFPVDEAMQERLRVTFGESFHEIMQDSRDYEPTESLGRNVVLIRGYLTDVATGLPPALAGTNVNTVRWIWEGNLTLEVRDSMSDTVLIRIINRQRVEGPVEAERIWSLAPQVTRMWSRSMSEQLSTIADFYPSRLRRLHERTQSALD